MSRGFLFDPIVRDLRYAARMLRKAPGFTLTVVITLAVGIGINSAVYSVVYGWLLKPLPYPEPDRLATVVWHVRSPRASSMQLAVDGRTFLAIRDNATTVNVAVSGPGLGGGVNLIAGEQAANVRQGRVSSGYLGVLGVSPLMGREFSADEDRPAGEAAVILSHRLWVRVFDADPGILGRSIQLRGEAHTVVGVMPEGFTTGTDADLWTPVRAATTGEGGGANYGMIARVRPGVSWDQADAEIGQLGTVLVREQSSNETTVRLALLPLHEGKTRDIRQPLLMLWGAVGLVLLIACVNVAGLLIARSGSRTREIATRMALGSGRGAVIRQLLLESAVLAFVGGALGAALGWIVLHGLKALGGTLFPLAYPVELDARVLTMTLVMALSTSVVFGLVPALQASRIDVHGALAQAGTRSIAGGVGGWARRILVISEVAIGVVLLVSAGLLVRTFVHLRNVDPGSIPPA